jgi:hypothetical protein
VTKPALILIEGPEKATRGGEWEPIKIPRRNLDYIPKPYSYSKAIGLQNRIRDRSGTLNSASKTTCEIDDKIRIEEQFISSQAFHRTPCGRVQKTII